MFYISTFHLYSNNVVSNFQQLSTKFNSYNHDLFKYLQLRHWIQAKSVDFPNIPEVSPLEDHMFCTLITTAKGLTSSIYSILNNNSPIYNTLAIKHKWETDLGCTYDDVDWEFLLERAQRVLISTKHRQIS